MAVGLAAFGASVITKIIIGGTFKLIATALTPKKKKDPPAEVRQLSSPTAKNGTPIVVAYGTPILSAPNVLFDGQSPIRYVRAQAEGKKG